MKSEMTIRFRSASFEITVDEDGLIDSLEHNGRDVYGLMFDLGLLAEIQTKVCIESQERLIESVELLKHAS